MLTVLKEMNKVLLGWFGKAFEEVTLEQRPKGQSVLNHFCVIDPFGCLVRSVIIALKYVE